MSWDSFSGRVGHGWAEPHRFIKRDADPVTGMPPGVMKHTDRLSDRSPQQYRADMTNDGAYVYQDGWYLPSWHPAVLERRKKQ